MQYKDLLAAYTSYNRYANGEMVRILKTLPPARLDEPIGSYYKTLVGLINHPLRSCVMWGKRMTDADLFADYFSPIIASFPQAPLGQPVFSSLDEYASLREKADAMLAGAAARAKPEELDLAYDFIGFDKQKKTMTLGGTLLTIVNHETHHRGAVATILDGWGIENDWSSLMRFMQVQAKV